MSINIEDIAKKIRITQPLLGEYFNYNREATILDMIEIQAASSPNYIAVKYQDTGITYQQLLSETNQLASYLLNYGALSGACIALYLEPSIDLIVSILAILKIGCAFVPLDINYPHDRLNFILKDSSVQFLITTSTLKNRLSIDLIDCITLDAERESVEVISEFPKVSSSNIAYVIYTSGSTGVPKGVCIHHQAVNNHMTWMSDYFHFSKADIILLRTPISFDPSVWEVLLPLYIGGTLVIAPMGTYIDPTALLQLIDVNHITTIQFVPSIMHEFLKEKKAHQCHSLRRIFSGGESIRRETKLLYFSKFNCPLYNLYGPTETTIEVVSYEVTPDKLNTNIIGDPIYNNNIYILNEDMTPTDINEPGELYIEGESVGKGYINRPEETAKKFIDNPFTHYYGAKLYKTGDIAKITKDGTLEYIGRSNDQVKINGVRIEPAEIVNYILQDPAVYDCLVIPQKDTKKRSFLACYLTPSIGKKIDINEIKDRLSHFFPRYMLPKTYSVLEKFPLKENGKLDVSALPVSKIAILSEKSFLKKVSNPYEEVLYEIWRNILEVDSFDLNDTFFDLGGDSILALELISKIKTAFDVNFPVKDIFSCETVSAQADMIANLNNTREEIMSKEWNLETTLKYSVIKFRETGHKTPLFLIHPIGGTVFWYSNLASLLDKSRPFYGIQDPALDYRKNIFSSIYEMAECYYSMIKKVQPHGPYIVGGASFGGTVAIEIAALIEKNNEKVLCVPILDGWAIYPDTLRDVNYFKLSMDRQYEYSKDQFLKQGLTDQEFLLGIQRSRLDFLWKFSLKSITCKIEVFKATETLPIFLEIEDDTNHWKKYFPQTVNCCIVPGNHETMFQFPNVKKLAFFLNKILDSAEDY